VADLIETLVSVGRLVRLDGATRHLQSCYQIERGGSVLRCFSCLFLTDNRGVARIFLKDSFRALVVGGFLIGSCVDMPSVELGSRCLECPRTESGVTLCNEYDWFVGTVPTERGSESHHSLFPIERHIIIAYSARSCCRLATHRGSPLRCRL
jgi:hypothetical protein